MAPDMLRDSALGQSIRFLTAHKFFPYPEERPDFEPPSEYKSSTSASSTYDIGSSPAGASTTNPDQSFVSLAGGEKLDDIDDKDADLERVATKLDEITRPESAHLDVEKQGDDTLKPTVSTVVAPAKLDDGTVLVDWYTNDDDQNPQNWSRGKKAFVVALIMIYTTAVYMGGSIYAPAEGGVMKALGTSAPVAELGLALYVVGYGLGPLLWSPLSEVPAIGRNPIYIATFAIFTILSVPTALVNNIGGFLVLRFLQGFFGSPALATGGASLSELYGMGTLPYLISFWALAACAGPAIGPMISGFSVTAENWHWAEFEILWLAGPTFLVMFMAMPETNPGTILLHRAQRLRLTHTDTTTKLMSQSEIDQGSLSFNTMAINALYRPFQLNALDPSIAFTSVYTALMYALFYSFFEAFPLVYIDIYHFNLGELGVAFLSAAVGFGIGTLVYMSWIRWYSTPRIAKNGFGPPEDALLPGLGAAFLMPIGMFIYGWTSRPEIHWIVPSIGVAIVTFGVFIVFQCVFLYLPMTYPAYVASLFAGNCLIRSSLAAGSILYSGPLYGNLGVGPGSSLLACLMSACVVGLWVLWWFGARLRARSKFSAK